MKRLSRLILDNPTVGRQLATTFTGPRLGIAFLFVNLVILVAYALGFELIDSVSDGSPEGFASAVFCCFHFVVLFFFLCLLVPIKIAGYVEGPRSGKVFDQLVVTGVSPLRLHFGTWFVGMLYAALIMFVTLPFAGCAVYFLEVEIADMALGYAILLLYTNVIIALTLANSMFEREWVSVPMTILVLGFMAFFSLMLDGTFMHGFTVHVAEFTPIRLLLRCFLWDNMDVPGGVRPFLNADPQFFGLTISLAVYPFLLWGSVVLVCLLVITLGPSHHFANGFNTFGTVVLKGDRKKRLTRRLRGALSRRVELAFFYENRPRWCERWEFPVRSLYVSLIAVALWSALLGYNFWTTTAPFSRVIYHDERLLFSFFAGCFILCVMGMFLCDPRYMIYREERFGALRFRREFGQTAVFLTLVSLFFAMQWVVFGKALEDLKVQGVSPEDLDYYGYTWFGLIPAILLFVVNMFFFSRLVCRTSDSVMAARGGMAMSIFVLLFMPLLVLLMVLGGVLPRSVGYVGCLTPVVLAEDFNEGVFGHAERVTAFYMTHSVFLALQLLWLGYLHVTLTRRQKKSAARRAAAAVAAALMFLVLWTPHASAQTTAINVDGSGSSNRRPELQQTHPSLFVDSVHRGFDGFIFQPTDDFYTIVLRNDSMETERGEFYTASAYGASLQQSERQPFEIGPGTTKILRRDNSSRPGASDPTAPVTVVFETERGRAVSDWEHVVHLRTDRGALYLIIGDKRHTSREWSAVATNGQPENIIDCAPIAFPAAIAHLPAIAGVVTDTDALAQCSREQRDALARYIHLGGFLLVSGKLAKLRLSEDEALRPLLRTRESRTVESWSRVFHLERLEDGEAAFVVEDENGQDIVLAHTRHFGFGAITHASFSLIRPQLPQHLESSATFWSEFHGSIPTGRYPFVSRPVMHNLRYLSDPSMLFALLGFLVAYILVLGLGLLFAFRRKTRTPKSKWIYITACPVVFLCCAPILNSVFHARPSYARLQEVVYFGPGARDGIVSSHLHLVSSGRQRHSMTIAGASVSAFASDFTYRNHSSYYGHYLPTLRDNLLADQDEDLAVKSLKVLTTPWSSREVVLTAAVRREQPLLAVAEYDASTSQVDLQIELPPGLDSGQMRVYTKGFGSADATSHSAHGFAVRNGVAEGSVDVSGEKKTKQNPRWRYGRNHTDLGVFQFAWPDDDRSRVFVSWTLDDSQFPGIRIDSDDVLFRREISQERFEIDSGHRRLGYDTVREGDRFFQDFHKRMLLIELPVKTR